MFESTESLPPFRWRTLLLLCAPMALIVVAQSMAWGQKAPLAERLTSTAAWADMTLRPRAADTQACARLDGGFVAITDDHPLPPWTIPGCGLHLIASLTTLSCLEASLRAAEIAVETSWGPYYSYWCHAAGMVLP